MTIPAFERWRKNPYSSDLITFDPGETTGWSKWKDGKLIDTGHLNTKTVKDSILTVQKFLEWGFDYRNGPDYKHIVMEEYRIYEWKTEQHAWKDVHTLRLIGGIETLCAIMNIPYSMQGAGIAKKFADDEKLREWGFWQPGMRHARDAIRHACYFYCSPPKPPK